MGDDQAMLRATPLATVRSIIADMTRPGAIRSSNNLAVTQEMVRRLGLDHELNALPFIHVAGTKGKGSTCFATANLLRHQGLRVGLFTSPHLSDVRERFLVDGSLLDAKVFSDYMVEFRREHDAAWDREPWQPEVNADGTPGSVPQRAAFFRFMFLLSLRVFAAERVDVVVLEVGLGGRIDSTNVVAPRVTGITALGMDHMEFLGNTIESIASEKAGIIKTGVPCFSCPQADYPQTLAILREKAETVQAPFHVVESNAFETGANEGGGDWACVRPRGLHMVDNAKLALALTRTFVGKPLSDPVTSTEFAALRESAYPGRSEVVEGIRDGGRFHLDGAHTPESIRAAARWFFEQAAPGDSRDASILFFTSRDPKRLLTELLPYAHRIRRLACIRFPHAATSALPATDVSHLEAAQSAWESVRAETDNAGVAAVECVVIEDPVSSVQELAAAAGTGGTQQEHGVPVLVTGSLYLIGAARDLLSQKPLTPQ